MDKQELYSLAAAAYRIVLNDAICEVTFIKADGSVRVLRGTTNESYLDQEARNYIQSPSLTTTRVNVYDLDLYEWRSFLADRVIDLEIIKDLNPEAASAEEGEE